VATTAATLEELESESADLLPSRETLCCRPCGCGGLEVVLVVGIFL
jgi:hypothetical protein